MDAKGGRQNARVVAELVTVRLVVQAAVGVVDVLCIFAAGWLLVSSPLRGYF